MPLLSPFPLGKTDCARAQAATAMTSLILWLFLVSTQTLDAADVSDCPASCPDSLLLSGSTCYPSNSDDLGNVGASPNASYPVWLFYVIGVLLFLLSIADVVVALFVPVA